MAILENHIWANGIEVTAPSTGKIAGGFVAGDADPDLFNWLLAVYSEATYENQQAIEQLQQDTNNRSEEIEENLNARTGSATTSTEGVAKLSLFTDYNNRNVPLNDTKIMTAKNVRQLIDLYGAFYKVFEPSSWMTVDVVKSDSDSVAEYSPAGFDNIRGLYIVRVNRGVLTDDVSLLITFAGAAGTPSAPDRAWCHVDVLAGGSGSGYRVEANIQPAANLIRFEIQNPSGTNLDNYTIENVIRYNISINNS